jgi:hypothetical protein
LLLIEDRIFRTFIDELVLRKQIAEVNLPTLFFLGDFLPGCQHLTFE